MLNKDKMGVLVFNGCVPLELVSCNFAFTCENCDKSYMTLKVKGKEVLEQACMECFKKMQFRFMEVKMAIVEKETTTPGPKKQAQKGSKKK